jgi:stage V sporulation protein G
MEITDVRIKKVDEGTKVRATASITIDGVFVVHGVKIIDSANGIFAAMPSRKMEDGKYMDLCHPITSEVRQQIQKAILDKYNEIA